jgi:Ca-activated chloride channel family protein
MMRFGNMPAAYLLLIFLPLLLLCVWGYGKRRQAVEAFAQRSLLAELVPPPAKNRWVKILLAPAVLALCILALMRPQGGSQIETVRQSGLDIIVALDVSRSMLARDVKPNRFEFSRSAVRSFLQTLRGDRVGLVAFSGSAFLVCPLTVDYQALELVLDGIDRQTIPRGGTSLANAIAESIKGFRGAPQGSRVIIVLTDGEGHEGDILQAAGMAEKEGIKIFTVGIGTAAGELIPLTGEGRGGFLKDGQGNVVKSRLDEEGLRRVALAGGGDYLRAAEAGQVLPQLYTGKLAKLTSRETERKTRQNYREWFQFPLGLAFLLLAIGPWLLERKTDR